MTMSLGSKRHLLFRFNIFNKNKEILKDGAKYVLIFSLVVCKILNVWPEDDSVSKKVCFGAIVSICIVHQASLVMSLAISVEDVETFTRIIASLGCVMQVTVKIVIVFYQSHRLDRLIKIIRYEFWPSDIMGADIDRGIRKYSRKLFKIFIAEYFCGQAFMLLNVVIPFTKPIRILPHSAWYPFDWTRSPTYELLFAFHTFFNTYINNPAVAGYDKLFCAICSNCTMQFRLLCAAIRRVGSGKEGELLRRLQDVFGDGFEAGKGRKERRLLVGCVKHHQKLIHVCEELNNIFGNGHLIQLLTSVMGICTACYRITTEPNLNNIMFQLVFYLAHLFQLFIYCAVSNELSYWSTQLSTAAYESLWYKEECGEIRKYFPTIIARSQKPISMSAFGLFVLNYTSFVSVMRFSFSLYTFLDTMSK